MAKLLSVLLVATALFAAASASHEEQKFIMADGKLIPSNGVPLFDYINAPDSHYTWTDTGIRLNDSGWHGFMLNLTSQQWLTPQDVSKSVWTHQLLVIVPDELKKRNHAIIYVTGGGNDNPHTPKKDDVDVLVSAVLAVQTGAIAAVLWQVPNQPQVFADDPLKHSRGEDGLVAYTWRHIVDQPTRPDYVAYLPMVKSVVRAMDAITEFVSKLQIANIKKFVVAGASKRGATTWLTGAYDGSLPVSQRRVLGIAPIVFDMLRLERSVPHMYEAYGGWTFAFNDYWVNNVTVLLGTPKMKILTDVVDPISYVDTLTMPKLIITATGDEFFMPDDNWYWWDELKHEKHLLMVQNAEHSMATGVQTLFEGAASFFEGLVANDTRPTYTWTIDEATGTLTMKSKTKPEKVTLMIAETVSSKPNRRDFRMIKGNTPLAPCDPPAVKINDKICLNPIYWADKEVKPTRMEDDQYVYEYVPTAPASGNWLGFFYQVKYPAPNNSTYTTTTQVSIWPRVFPFQPCGSGESCRGGLV